jgi:hypothetical protein
MVQDVVGSACMHTVVRQIHAVIIKGTAQSM